MYFTVQYCVNSWRYTSIDMVSSGEGAVENKRRAKEVQKVLKNIGNSPCIEALKLESLRRKIRHLWRKNSDLLVLRSLQSCMHVYKHVRH